MCREVLDQQMLEHQASKTLVVDMEFAIGMPELQDSFLKVRDLAGLWKLMMTTKICKGHFCEYMYH